MAGDGELDFVLYRYTPSLPAAAIFCALFAIGTFAHLYYVFKLKAKYFIPFVIGCICQYAPGCIVKLDLTYHS